MTPPSAWASIEWPLWALCLFTSLGAAVLYCKLNYKKSQQKIYGLSPLLERFVPNERTRYIMEPVLFILVGTAVGLALTQPTNPTQAIAAGLGWTAALSSG